ncbi:MAG: hypothetical protein CMC18_02075 [Flavobacteriaceae bacterium]|nr:hypothetical protein [Flavobacteriaceae bacterium]
MKLKLTIALHTLLIYGSLTAQNIFLNRDYWKNSPSLEQVKEDIHSGNDPTELNKYAFDATIYALLENSDDEVIKYLLSLDGNTIDKKTHDSRIYLHWAAYVERVTIVNYLLKKGSSYTDIDSRGYTPLAFAANAGRKNKELYEAFEEHGVNLLDEKNSYGADLLLLIAPSLISASELNYFLEKGFTLTSKDNKGNGIFNYAAKGGNIEFLKLLVEKGIEYKSVNNEGGNAVLYASMGKRGSDFTIESFEYLESLGLRINVVGHNGYNPLHRIAFNSHDDALFDYFINKGVDINLQDYRGASPFMNAANSNKLAILKLLFPKVTDINTQDYNGCSALAMAINNNDVEVVEFLLENGADIGTIDKDGNTLAFYLLNTFGTNKNVAFEAKWKLLKAKGLLLNKRQKGGNTLLHLATLKNNLALLKWLSSFNININATNNEGYTALHLAAMKSDTDDILKHLLKHWANQAIRTEFGESVLELASENEQLQRNNVSLDFLK